MFRCRHHKVIMNILLIVFAFVFGCTITLSLLSVEKDCDKGQTNSLSQQSDSGERGVFLVVLILSAPKNVIERNTIRNTWLKSTPRHFDNSPSAEREFRYDEKGFLVQDSVSAQRNQLEQFKRSMEKPLPQTEQNVKILHYFAIGTSSLATSEFAALKIENEKQKDLLLIGDLRDSYANLTQKLLRSIDALDNMSSFKYLLKVDDDTYVKLDLLLADLLAHDIAVSRQFYSIQKPKPELYWGYFSGRANIKTRGHWREKSFNLCDRYLPYALGGGYVISRKLVALIAVNSHLLNVFTSEDASMGLWLSAYRNIYRRHDVRFDTAYMPRSCRDYHIVLHKRTVDDMIEIERSELCSFKDADNKEIHRPIEYFYDWNQVPSKCCDVHVEP